MANAYHARALNVTQDQGVTVLDCIGWPGPTGDMGLRVFFKAGTDHTRLKKAGEGCITVTDARSVSGAVVVAGTVAAQTDTVTMALSDGRLTLPVQAPETELLEGLNICIAERNGEPIEVVEDWVNYHVTHFGLQGVVLIDRAEPGGPKGFARQLRRLTNKSGLQALVHLTCAVPWGREDLPPVSHPFNAPDAPGKDRMGELPNDPWSAPWGQSLIHI